VTDSTGTSVTGGFTVTVKNVAPTVVITSPGSGATFKNGSTVSFSASFSDPGKSDTHTCTITWGDGATSIGTVSETNGAGTCTGNHAYGNGTYTISVAVTDNSGAVGTASVSIAVTKNGKRGGALLLALVVPGFTTYGAAAMGKHVSKLHRETPEHRAAHMKHHSTKAKRHVVRAKHHAARKKRGHAAETILRAAALVALRRVERFQTTFSIRIGFRKLRR
jgi:PKD domain